jgi:hypothetical protein
VHAKLKQGWSKPAVLRSATARLGIHAQLVLIIGNLAQAQLTACIAWVSNRNTAIFLLDPRSDTSPSR